VRLISDFFFIILFVVLLVAWLIFWAALHVAGGLVHLLIVFAVIALILHFVRGGRRTV
jgi:hypothetical protein